MLFAISPHIASCHFVVFGPFDFPDERVWVITSESPLHCEFVVMTRQCQWQWLEAFPACPSVLPNYVITTNSCICNTHSLGLKELLITSWWSKVKQTQHINEFVVITTFCVLIVTETINSKGQLDFDTIMCYKSSWQAPIVSGVTFLRPDER